MVADLRSFLGSVSTQLHPSHFVATMLWSLEVYKFSVNGVAEFLVKGNTSMQEYDWLEFISPLLRLEWLQWTGAAVFFWGWIRQRNCHKILVCCNATLEFRKLS